MCAKHPIPELIVSMDVLRKILENDFDALKIKLFVAATDLIKGEPVIFSKGAGPAKKYPGIL